MNGLANKRLSTIGGLPKFKVVLLGEVGVGKSALFLRLKDDVFGANLQPTVGIESCSKLVSTEDEKVMVWDTAGVERFRTLTRNYYRNTHATFLMYSLDNPTSLHYLTQWIQDSQDAAPNALMFLIGNKSDLEWSISKTSIEDFAAAHDFDSAFIISAKTGEGIETALSVIGQKLLDTYKLPIMQDTFLDNTIYINTRKEEKDLTTCLC